MKNALELCREADGNSDFELAVLLAEEHLRVDPKCAEAKLLLARNLVWLGKSEDAERIARELCGSAACSADSLYLWAETQHHLNQPGAAAATLQRLINRFPLTEAMRKKVAGMIERYLLLVSMRATRNADQAVS